MKTRAAVLVELDRPLELVDLDIPPLRPGQVLVEVAYSGVCHTQLSEVRGRRGPDAFLPHCLGHEASGIVRECGPAVSRVKAGDAVVLSWIKGAGFDVPGTTYSAGGRTVNAGGITTFQNHTVVSENRLTVLPAAFPLRDAALIGCALPTGAGVVFNTMQPRPGQSLAVFGVGGIGLCAIAAAALSGCCPVVAIDVVARKLDLARTLGATHVVDASLAEPAAELKKLVPGGLDWAVESSGKPAVMRQALAAVRMQGGTAVVVGNARFGDRLELDPKEFNQGKRLFGTWGGDNVPERDYPRYVRLMAAGKLNLAPLLANEYRLTEINQAIADLEQGAAIRPLIALSGV